MATDPNHITIRITVKNRKAVLAFREAVELIQEAADDHPWRADIQRALQLLQQCGRSLRPCNRRRKP